MPAAPGMPPLNLDLSAGPSQASGGTGAASGAFGDFNFKGTGGNASWLRWVLLGGVAVFAIKAFRK